MNDDEVLLQFIEEGFSRINDFETKLLSLESKPEDLELLEALYRDLHTIKGAAGFFSFGQLEAILHKTETLFSLLQKQESEVRKKNIEKIIDLLFKVNDSIKEILKAIESKQDLKNYTDLITEIDQKTNGAETLSVSKLDSLREKALGNLKSLAKKEEIKLDDQLLVKSNTLETLSSLSAELILVRNKLDSIVNSKDEYVRLFQSSFYKIDNLINRINERVMKIRMQPLSIVTNKLKRIIRDFAINYKKEIELIIEGEEIELDRSILDAIKDPLIHLLRNAIDHGIEEPELREKFQKNQKGTVKVQAFNKNNQIHLLIADDGRGIDSEKIRSKILEKKLLTEDQLLKLNEQEIINFIFYAGFSTKEKISNISGRGVGLDVVKDSVAKINGSIEIKTQKNVGSEFLLKLPLTLALSLGVIVEIAENEYVIPASFVKSVNTVSYSFFENKNFIEVREEFYEVVFAQDLLLKEKYYLANDNVDYLLIELGNLKFAFVVDAVLDLQDIVIKALPKNSENLALYQGCTILPKGNVALIFDMEIVYQVNRNQFLNIFTDEKLPEKIFQDTGEATTNLFLTFKLSDYTLAISKRYIKEVMANLDVTPIPGTQLESLINVRDHVLLNKNLKKILDIKNDKPSSVQIILNMQEKDFSLQVDEIDEFIEIDKDSELLKSPDESIQPFIKRAYLIDNHPIYLLDERFVLI